MLYASRLNYKQFNAILVSFFQKSSSPNAILKLDKSIVNFRYPRLGLSIHNQKGLPFSLAKESRSIYNFKKPKFDEIKLPWNYNFFSTSTSIMDELKENIRKNWEDFQARVDENSKEHRLSTKPMILAVSKIHPVEAIRAAYEIGVRHFGENYVQEMIEKYQKLPSEVKWHLIGHLQSNKCKTLLVNCPNLYMIETLDSEKLATKLQQAAETVSRKEKLKVLVQIKTAEDEENKTGIIKDSLAIINLVQFVLNNCPDLDFCGLMTVGDIDHQKAAQGFKFLNEMRDTLMNDIPLCKEKFQNQTFHLSMGMSGDYKLAISEGSTEIRIGSAIFGPRIRNKK